MKILTFITYALIVLFFLTANASTNVFAQQGIFGPIPPEGCPASHYPSGGSCYPKTNNQCKGLLDCVKNIQSPSTTFTEDQGLVGTVLSRIIPLVIGFGGMLAVVFIVISGIQFVTSGGDPKAAEAARARLIYAVIGFAVLILAYAALQIIDELFLNTGVAG